VLVALPEIVALIAIPLMSGVSLPAVRGLLAPARSAAAVLAAVRAARIVFVLGSLGLAYSIYPYVVLDR
jgi:cytochrome d ubiquinol oxidase subunit II